MHPPIPVHHEIKAGMCRKMLFFPLPRSQQRSCEQTRQQQAPSSSFRYIKRAELSHLVPSQPSLCSLQTAPFPPSRHEQSKYFAAKVVIFQHDARNLRTAVCSVSLQEAQQSASLTAELLSQSWMMMVKWERALFLYY